MVHDVWDYKKLRSGRWVGGLYFNLLRSTMWRGMWVWFSVFNKDLQYEALQCWSVSFRENKTGKTFNSILAGKKPKEKKNRKRLLPSKCTFNI